MPVWPKSFHTFGASLRTASTEWQLRQKSAAVPAQQKAFTALTRPLAATSYWKAVGVELGMTYDRFRTRVPLHRHEHLAPAIERMQRGESNVLWPGACTLFATTAGTTTGQPRAVPMTNELLGHVRAAGYAAALYYTVRVRHAGAFRGRHLMFGSPPALAPIPGASASFSCDLSGIAALNLPPWADKHFYEPGVSTAAIPDFDARLDEIARRAASRDVTVLAGLPTWLLLLAETIRSMPGPAGGRIALLQQLWPNLEACFVSGLPLAPYLDQLRAALGPEIVFHEIYAATEACIAAQDTDGRHGLRLMANHGVFFEFLPLADYDASRLDQLGARALPLSEIKTGVDYALLLTTPGGLARYLLGDVVRFTSTSPHRLVHVGGTELRVNATGENVSEREVTEALAGICQRRNWSIVNFHVAPLLGAADLTGQAKTRHEWWVELKPGTVATPTGPQMAAELDPEMQRLNRSYAAQRQSGALDAPFVRLVMPGVFEHWQRFHHRWGGQAKIPRCRSDRLLADDLAQITNFARD